MLTKRKKCGIIYNVANAPLAQPVEHLTFNQGVCGSIPQWSTTKKHFLGSAFLLRKEIKMIKKGIYRHFKGNMYELLFTATHSETLETMVVYRALYGEGGIWVRPLSMWEEKIERDGKCVPRFEFVPGKED